jgi:hypothetical protein
MNVFENNPFGLLTFLVAPAILTNASSIMVLSTSNRFGLAIDRVKAIASDIENRHTEPGPDATVRLEHLKRAETRVLLLVRALTSLYLTVGSFVTASLISLLGAALFAAHEHGLRQVALVASVCAGLMGFAGLVSGCAILIRESRLALHLLTEETAFKARHYYSRFTERLQQTTDGPPGS